MQSNHNPFPLSGDNFRTVVRVDSDLELSLMILELGFPVLGADDYTDEELAADYAIAMQEFKRCLGTAQRTDTVDNDLIASVIATA